MKFNIHGFYQPRAVELGLTNDDLLVLRWFVDFAGTAKMKTILDQDGIYYWINYSTILEDLPVLQVSKTTLKRKHFDKLCATNVLKHKHIKDGGSFSYYAYGINYDTLVYLQDDNPSTELPHPSTNFTYPCVNSEQPLVQNCTNKDYSIIYNTIKDNNIYGQTEKIDNPYEDKFQTFYNNYPKKVQKQNVLKWFQKNKPSDELFTTMMNKLKQFKNCPDWIKDNGQYIPHPTTWLNQKRWEDNLEVDTAVFNDDDDYKVIELTDEEYLERRSKKGINYV